MIVGTSGAGKTYAIKNIFTSRLRPFGIPQLFLDYNDDFSTSEFLEENNATLVEADEGISLNPLVPTPDPRSGRVRLPKHVFSLSGTLRQVFGLGEQQEADLRNAMYELYESCGLSRNEHQDPRNVTWPSFMELGRFLVDQGNQQLVNRVSPLFDLELFQGTDGTLGDLLEQTSVLRLSQLPNEQIKNAVADMFLRGVYQTLLNLGPLHEGGMRIAILIDEAHKVSDLDTCRVLLKEARKYGACVWLSSQEPTDFGESVFANCATFVSMRLELDAHAKKAAQQLGDPNLKDQIRSLPVGEGFLRNGHYMPYTRIKFQ